jgi:uncharacterized protein GlcG (DUF336 family)
MTVAVVYAGGCLMVLMREDGSDILRPYRLCESLNDWRRTRQ